MDFEQMSRSLLPLLGGKENIASAAHCATRLRLVLVDDALLEMLADDRDSGENFSKYSLARDVDGKS